MAAIGEKTTVRLGLVCAAVVVMASTVWWASEVSTKLDVLLTGQAAVNIELRAVQERIADLETRVRVLEAR